MAAGYIKEIRKIQAKGPYYLGGHSFGGLVVFEMAQQLHQLGQEVAFVGLLDTYFPQRGGAKQVIEGIRFHGRRFMDSKDKLRYLVRRFRRHRWSRKLWNSFPPEVKAFWRASTEAARMYRPQLYAGRVTLLKVPGEDAPRSRGLSRAWRRCAGGGLDVREISGTHDNMFTEPHLSVLAEQLQGCLDRAQKHHMAKADFVEAS